MGLGQGDFKVVELSACLNEFDTFSNTLDYQLLFEKRARAPLTNSLLGEELKSVFTALSLLFCFSIKCFIFLHTYKCTCTL